MVQPCQVAIQFALISEQQVFAEVVNLQLEFIVELQELTVVQENFKRASGHVEDFVVIEQATVMQVMVGIMHRPNQQDLRFVACVKCNPSSLHQIKIFSEVVEHFFVLALYVAAKYFNLLMIDLKIKKEI